MGLNKYRRKAISDINALQYKMEKKTKFFKKLIWIIPAVMVGTVIIGFYIYTADYYHAEYEAYEALISDEKVTVEETDYGWFFDGYSEDELFVFYPGGKVEAAAYAPFMRTLADKGIDVCLVKMPFNLAVFGKDKAGSILEKYGYESCWVGGHSLGGVMAASFAADNRDSVNGVILCASYPNEPLPEGLIEITVYGSEDKVLEDGVIEEAKQYAPSESYIYEIRGGNHGNFGNYGEQAGDGKALLTWEEQQNEAVEFIVNSVMEKATQDQRNQ